MSDTHEPGGDKGQDELDLYIDGLLDDERRAAFERKLFADPELAAELERQRSLDSRLSAAFPVPENPVLVDMPVQVPAGSKPAEVPAGSVPANSAAGEQGALNGRRPRPAGGPRRTWQRVAMAASVLVAVGLWAVGDYDVADEGAGGVVDEGPVVVVDAGGQSCSAFGGLYAELADDWRMAAGACNVPHDLSQHFQDSLGQALFVDATAELAIEGPFAIRRWPTTTLLASPQQPEPILILVDELARDPRPVLEADSPAHLFRRELGDLVLYELTPWDAPRALELFRLQ